MQWFSLLVSIIFMGVCLIRMRVRPESRYLRIPVIVLLAHHIIYYSYLYLDDFGISFLPHNDAMAWSTILRMHMLITFLAIELYGMLRDMDVSWKCKR